MAWVCDQGLLMLFSEVKEALALWFAHILNGKKKNKTSAALCWVLFKFSKTCPHLGRPIFTIACVVFKLRKILWANIWWFMSSLWKMQTLLYSCCNFNVTTSGTTTPAHVNEWKLMCVGIFHTFTAVTQIEKLFRFHVHYSRDLNLLLCHMV